MERKSTRVRKPSSKAPVPKTTRATKRTSSKAPVPKTTRATKRKSTNDEGSRKRPFPVSQLPTDEFVTAGAPENPEKEVRHLELEEGVSSIAGPSHAPAQLEYGMAQKSTNDEGSRKRPLPVSQLPTDEFVTAGAPENPEKEVRHLEPEEEGASSIVGPSHAPAQLEYGIAQKSTNDEGSCKRPFPESQLPTDEFVTAVAPENPEKEVRHLEPEEEGASSIAGPSHAPAQLEYGMAQSMEESMLSDKADEENAIW